MSVVVLYLTVEAKEEYPGPDPEGRWREGYEPGAEEAARYLGPILADETKHDGDIGWRVTAVRTS